MEGGCCENVQTERCHPTQAHPLKTNGGCQPNPTQHAEDERGFMFLKDKQRSERSHATWSEAERKVTEVTFHGTVSRAFVSLKKWILIHHSELI